MNSSGIVSIYLSVDAGGMGRGGGPKRATQELPMLVMVVVMVAAVAMDSG